MRPRGRRRRYFAYGSNLDREQMRSRCPGALPLAAAHLGGYEVAFVGASAVWDGGGVATLAPARGGRVSGLVYALTDADVARLDDFEGCPFVYERRGLRLVLEGQRVRAFTYVRRDAAPALPSLRYLATIATAYRRLGFDLAALRRACQ